MIIKEFDVLTWAYNVGRFLWYLSKCIFLVLIRQFIQPIKAESHTFKIRKSLIYNPLIWIIFTILLLYPPSKISEFPRGTHDDGTEDLSSFSFTPTRPAEYCARERCDKQRRVEVVLPKSRRSEILGSWSFSPTSSLTATRK